MAGRFYEHLRRTGKILSRWQFEMFRAIDMYRLATILGEIIEQLEGVRAAVIADVQKLEDLSKK